MNQLQLTPLEDFNKKEMMQGIMTIESQKESLSGLYLIIRKDCILRSHFEIK